MEYKKTARVRGIHTLRSGDQRLKYLPRVGATRYWVHIKGRKPQGIRRRRRVPIDRAVFYHECYEIKLISQN